MKHKIIAILLATTIALSLSACSSGIKEEDYESVKTELSNLQSEKDALQSEKDAIEANYEAVEAEYESYKERMGPYETIEQADAEARLQEIQESKEAEEAAKAAEEAKGYETGITYDQLARTPDDYTGQKVKFYGKVLQVMEGDTETHIRLAVDDNYDTVLYAAYSSDLLSSRVLEDDYITIYGVSLGLYSYEATSGATITIPSVWVDQVDQ